jgi:hypothetical protein
MDIVDKTNDLAEAGNNLLRLIAYRCGPKKRSKMVLAEGVKIDFFHGNDARIVSHLNDFVQDVLCPELIPGKEIVESSPNSVFR